MEKILQSHYQATTQRMSKHKIVLAVQDTSELNYSTLQNTDGLGPIGTTPDGPMGLLLHDTLAFTPQGVPLGLLDIQCWARDSKEFGKRELRHDLPIEQKESYKWLQSYEAVAKAHKLCPNTTIVSVGDRESDIYEFFAQARDTQNGPKILVRARQHRLLNQEQQHLWPTVDKEPLAGTIQVQVPRRGKRAARTADVEIRFLKAHLKPPRRKSYLGDITLWAVLAQERNAPDGVDALEWMLLTSVEVNDFSDAVKIVQWYCCRWGIEVFHRTLKSGCKIKERRFGNAQRIETCLAVDLVVAWRIFYLTKQGRETPDIPCTVFFEDHEWKALVFHKTKNAIPPEKPPSLREAVRMVAALGGFLGRKGDGEPGTQTTWKGLQRLDDIAETYRNVIMSIAPHILSPPVSKN